MGPDRTIEPERELKFETALDAALPDLRDLVGRTERLPQRLFSTVYFDTSDQRLWERGLTLRYRAEGREDEGRWTLKLPSPRRGSVLERTEVTWSGSRDTMPTGVSELTRGVTRRELLREIVELETVRQRLTLRDDHDEALGEIDDDVVRSLNGPRQGERFRQVELELAGDEHAVAGRVMERFASVRMSAGAAPKLAVALGLSQPDRGSSLRLGPGSALRDVLRAALWNGLDQLLTHDWRLRFAAPAVAHEDIHQARVAARRLRSNLKTLQPMLDPVWARHVRADLEWIGSALGDVRDADVLADHLPAASGELQEDLSRDRALAVQRLMPVLASDRYLALLDRLHAATVNPPVLPDDDVDWSASGSGKDQLTDLVETEWRALRHRVRASGAHPSDRQLHRIRIGAKRLRYAAELADPVIGKSARRLAQAAEEVQTVLGEHHDAVAAEAWLRAQVFSRQGEASLHVSVADAFAAGCLVAAERQTQEELRRSWGHSWKALRRQAKTFAG